MVVEQAWRMFQAGERDRAYQVADEVLALDPFDYRASELRLAQLLDHGAYAEARRLCLQLQAANPVSGWLWERRCEIAAGLEKGDELVEAGQAWLRSEPDEPRAHLEIAHGHTLSGDDGAARRALEDAIEALPGEADLHVALGDWHVDHDDHASARRAYREALELEPGLEVSHAPRVFDGYLDLTLRTLLTCMVAALAIAVPARLGLGGLWGGLVAIGLVGAAFWAHREWFGRMRAEVPEDHLRSFAERHRLLVGADVGALVAGVIAVVLAFVTDLAAQQVGVALVLAALAIGAGVGLLRRNPRP
ncbi:hypothetical protein GCM10028815_03890 [Mariniluteicoccus flavus]